MERGCGRARPVLLVARSGAFQAVGGDHVRVSVGVVRCHTHNPMSIDSSLTDDTDKQIVRDKTDLDFLCVFCYVWLLTLDSFRCSSRFCLISDAPQVSAHVLLFCLLFFDESFLCGGLNGI